MRYTLDPFNEPDRGILGEVPGQFIAEASAALPAAESAPAESMTADVSAAGLGLVRITYRQQRMRHGRQSHWAWVAVAAAKLGERLASQARSTPQSG